MFPFVKIFSGTFQNYKEVEVFQKMVPSSFYVFVVLSGNPFHADVPGKPLLLSLLCGLQCLIAYLFFPQNTGVSVFSSLLVPFKFWLRKERMNCGSVWD